MKTDIILSGVGGQGILSIAAVIGIAAIESGLYVKQAEVHGMSQRGGAVQSHLRISDKPVFSDLIPEGSCDLILSVEPMEALRYLPFLNEAGWIISNLKPFVNINDYPDEKLLLEEFGKISKSIIIDSDSIAAELGSRKVSNIVMLGSASLFIGLELKALEKSIKTLFGRKGDELVQLNIKAISAGRTASQAILTEKNL